jgi:hypothetical protein
MKKYLILTLVLYLLAACGGEPTLTPDLVATQIAVEDAAHATMTARIPTATSTPEPTPLPTITPTPRPTLTPPPDIEAEEYAVLAALIQHNPIGFDLGSSLVIREQTVADLDSLDRTWENVDPPPAELVDSYRSRNVARYTLGRNLDLEQDYTLMTEEEFDEIFRGGGAIWPKIEAKYPEARGVLIFSRVGFDADGDQALVSMGFRCGDLCGAGGLYLLVKEEGSWKFEKALMEWMS